jgi:long-chain acyl-CoA synthetase
MYAHYLEKWANEEPNRIFLRDETRAKTYREVMEEVSRLASLLPKRVLHIAFNSIESIEMYLASFWAGSILYAIDPLTSAEDLSFVIKDSKADLILTDEEISKREKINGLTRVKQGRKVEPYSYKEKEAGLVYYYAGIVGRTMQVLHSPNLVILNAKELVREMKIEEVGEISSLLTVPIAHVLGNSVLSLTLISGGKLTIMNRFDPEKASLLIERERVNFLSTVPLVYERLLSVSESKVKTLKLCYSSAAPLSPEVQVRFRDKFRVPILQLYGLTEGLTLTLQRKQHEEVLSTIGSPLPSVEIKLEEVKEGIGELYVKAPWIMLGYSDDKLTKEAIIGDYLRTGDLMYIDDKGLLYFKGMKKRMLKYKGYPIFPRDLEEIIKTHPKVEDAKVIGKEEGGLGSAPFALVKLKDMPYEGLKEEILDYVNKQVAFYKRLKGIEFVSSL